jgi:hypothetical protein
MPPRRRFRQYRNSKDKIGNRGNDKFNICVGLRYQPCMKSTDTIRDVKMQKKKVWKFTAIKKSSLCSSRFGMFLCGRICVQRQTNRESRALTRLTLDGNPAAVRSDNRIANRKA